ncbi:hypothetical protein T265_07419 [Opisthorchis viverrini]|uniref:GT23 domain-containing protein n=2 Tax=Opisthorchis viverrini TaxID=6198 RepID=A0A074ZH55_OPIVI|nr:hypothetical protein T265_07419 [Opisthorchis viverrini]KER25022.1 hypothetical protein T265_07419 [Opisthorchis viverrini]
MRYFKTIAFLLISLWMIVLMYISFGGLHSPRATAEYDEIVRHIDALHQRVLEGSQNLKKTIERLNLPVESVPQHLCSAFAVAPTGSVGHAHEVLRNRAINFAREIFFAVTASLKEINQSLANNSQVGREAVLASVESLRERVDEMTQHLEIDLDGLGRVDHLAENRKRELDRLGALVQQRLEKLQNPTDCSKAKLLLVSLTRPCAFGCNVHHLAYCLQLAYASGRTLILTGILTGYGEWWSRNFLPLSSTCSEEAADSSSDTFFDKNTINSPRIVECPYIGHLANLNWLPPAVPADLAPNLTRLHAAPSVWFIGQLITYLMRPAPQFARILNHTLISFGLVSPRGTPIAGLHVRRTDKVNTEAAFHSVKEYMFYVERRFRFWDAQQKMMNRHTEWINDAQPHYTSTTPRQVFIATDDPSVLDEARKQYPDYVFLGDSKRAESANVGSRGNADSITGVALDIMVLSKADYIVCTFSSQVCRISYELMQARHGDLGDASGLAQSLDDTYYYGGQQMVSPEVIIKDEASGLEPGEHIHVAGNHWNGFARVVGLPGRSDVMVPAYKYRPRVLVVPMGNFDD